MNLKLKKIIIDKLEYKKILGAYLQNYRINDGISLNYAAEGIGINKATLSEIENGIKTLTQTYREPIMKYYDIEFDFDEKLLVEIREYTFLMFESYIDLNEEKESYYLNLILNNKGKYLDSYAFFTFKLVKLFGLVRNRAKQSEIEKLSLLINTYIHIYNAEEKAVFYDILAVNEIYNANYSYALDLLELSLSEVKINGNINGLYGVVLYHNSIVLQCLNKSSMALEYCEDALYEFRKTFCYHRVFYLDMYKGNCLSRLKRYTEAEQQYLNLLEHIAFIKNTELEIAIYDNLSWNSLKAEWYEKCIEYANKAKSLNSDFSELALNIPYSLYKLGDHVAALKEINKVVAESEDEYINCFLYALKYFLIDEEEEFKTYATEFYELCVRKQDYEMEILILNLLQEYYISKDKYEAINIIRGKLLDYYKRN